MKTHLLLVAFFGTLLVFTGAVNGQRPATKATRSTPPPPSAPPATTVTELQQVFGTLEGRVYTNQYFGFEIHIPDDLEVAERGLQQLYADAGLDTIKNKTEKDTAQLDEAAKRTINMLLITKLPIGSPGNSAIEFTTAKQPPGATSRQAAAATSVVMTSTGSFKVAGRQGPKKLGSYTYEIIDLESSVFGATLDHRMFVTVIKNYSLVITITKLKEDTYDEFEALISSIAPIKKQ